MLHFPRTSRAVQCAACRAQVAQLSRGLADCEAQCRLFRDLEGTHSSVQRRLAEARINDGVYSDLPQMGATTASAPNSGRAERVRHIAPTGFMG